METAMYSYMKLYNYGTFRTCIKSSHTCETNKIGKVYSLEYNYNPKVFFTPHLVGSCFTVIRGHSCVLGHSCTNVIPSYCCSTMWSNNGNHWIAILHNKGFGQWYLRFHCCGKRDRHGPAHKVFFAYVRVWRTPKKREKHEILNARRHWWRTAEVCVKESDTQMTESETNVELHAISY
jgi:hypothetical protein